MLAGGLARLVPGWGGVADMAERAIVWHVDALAGWAWAVAGLVVLEAGRAMARGLASSCLKSLRRIYSTRLARGLRMMMETQC